MMIPDSGLLFRVYFIEFCVVQSDSIVCTI